MTLRSDTLWAVAGDRAEAVIAMLDDEARARETVRADSLPAISVAREAANLTDLTPDGIAIIRVPGAIDRTTVRGWLSGSMLAVGQDAIRLAVDAAAENPAVRAILLRIDSPGGVVAGTKELADHIAATAQGGKPVAAYVDGMAASAACWLAAATGRVYAPASGQIGSIGVIMEIPDYSAARQKAGVSIQYVSSGRWKAAGRGDRPLTDDERAYFESRLAKIHAIFAADVARHMSITASPEDWAEAQVLVADEAAALGLVSAIVRDLDDAANQLLEVAMQQQKAAPAAPAVADAPRADIDAAVAEARRTAGAEARERFLAVLRLAQVDEAATARITAALDAVAKLDLTAAQLDGMAGIMAAVAPPPAPAPEPDRAADARAEVLAALRAAHAPAVNAACPVPAAETRSPLVADAERRAARA